MSLAEYRVSDSVDVSLVDPLAERLLGLLEHFGGRVLIVSGRRSYAEQQALYNAYLAGGNLAAKPGTSNHEHGRAADLRIIDDTPWQHVHAEGFARGLFFPVPGEAWHTEADPSWVAPPPVPKVDDMTKEEFAVAIGAKIPTDGPFAGLVCVPLIGDDLRTTSLYPLADALTFTHQELKLARLSS